MNEMTEERLLLNAIRALGLSVKPSTRPEWQSSPAVRVIDCVLSLRQHYKSVVVPRTQKFAAEHPGIRTVSSLHELINSFPSPGTFLREILNFKHEQRANTLSAVVKWLAGIEGDGLEADKLKRLEKWAHAAKPQDHSDLGIFGFGLAGFQYLRMLFGADTAKPDVHICRFVSEAIGRNVSPEEALSKLEGAIRLGGSNMPKLRDVDTSVWEAYNNKKNSVRD